MALVIQVANTMGKRKGLALPYQFRNSSGSDKAMQFDIRESTNLLRTRFVGSGNSF